MDPQHCPVHPGAVYWEHWEFWGELAPGPSALLMNRSLGVSFHPGDKRRFGHGSEIARCQHATGRHGSELAQREHNKPTLYVPPMLTPVVSPKIRGGEGSLRHCLAEDVHPPAATTHPKDWDQDERRRALSPALPNEARRLNHQEVVEEDKRLKLPANWEAKKARLEWELKVEEKKKECAARGEDYERVKLLEISAEDAERWERKKKRKNPDLGFSDYAAAQLRQYQRLTRQIKPDLEQYEKLKEQYGEALYPTSDSLLHGTHVPSKEGVDRMVADLEKQIEKREKYSRRRPYNDDADIDYINERNAKFNKKAERFYGKYTAEIKQNLERGTAV
ncbi:pre-mRNA-splicing factor SYF2 [Athene cunicularia]|uniref:pre-mRNA-splicing factor SYF2 n=1 Tax=Athene cunicularia TaxID=194338 RepID=UPI000EF6F583|nr:pre-mRNA-splicing factor SYF2 [Athene cunicularia]